jgi:hypothetical protein
MALLTEGRLRISTAETLSGKLDRQKTSENINKIN